MARQKIAVLGSTGSIGEQTLEILKLHSDIFEPITLTAHRNWQRLAEQARELEPDSVVIGDKEFYEPLKNALKELPIKVYAGGDAVAQIGAEINVDVVVNALVGYAGLAPTVKALMAGKKIALANKESLVVAGELVMRLSRENRAPIVPIDSEHSAILQCLAGENSAPQRVILTASGGALRDVPLANLGKVTTAQALRHPNWSMGPKITIDSATLVNKGFEVVEAHWLFGLESEKIEVLLHPQSIVHSMVEFADGSVKAQLGTPDMRVPISYALSFPHRLPSEREKLKLTDLTFCEVDPQRYPALQIARDALAAGGTALCAMNAANEVAVEAFLTGRIGFLDIVKIIEKTFAKTENIKNPSLENYINCNNEAKKIANGNLN